MLLTRGSPCVRSDPVGEYLLHAEHADERQVSIERTT